MIQKGDCVRIKDGVGVGNLAFVMHVGTGDGSLAVTFDPPQHVCQGGYNQDQVEFVCHGSWDDRNWLNEEGEMPVVFKNAGFSMSHLHKGKWK